MIVAPIVLLPALNTFNTYNFKKDFFVFLLIVKLSRAE